MALFLPRGVHRAMHTIKFFKRVNEDVEQATTKEELLEILKRLGKWMVEGAEMAE